MHVTRWLLAASLACSAAFAQTAPRAEFEVASIKPSAEPVGGQQVNVGVHIDGAQVTCTFLNLQDYIRIAYKVKNYQISGPDWITAEHFDIAAKIPSGVARDQVPEMLQSLLTDRFGLKFHNDTKDFPVYALIIGKNGLKLKESKVDPDIAAAEAGRGGATVNVNASGGARGVHVDLGQGSYFTFADNKLEGGRLTMTRFADTLARFTDRPVVDMTNLTAAYDIKLDFTPEDYTAMLIRSAIAAGVALPPQALKALEYSSGDSLTSSLQTVGLKLDPRKAPLPVLVIDHMEKSPTAN
jgi:uncharacterized protein (TIGR03435 family)